MLNNNFVNYYNICEEEEDDEQIIAELGLISGLTPGDDDKTLTEFNENDFKLTPIFNETLTSELRNLSSTIYEENEDFNQLTMEKSISHLNQSLLINHNLDNLINHSAKRSNGNLICNLDNNSVCNSDSNSVGGKQMKCNGKIANGILNENEQDNKIDKHQNKINEDNSSNESNDCKSQISIDNQSNESRLVDENKQLSKKEPYLFSTCQSPQFIIINDKMRQCDLHAKQIIENCKLIEDLVLNF